MKVLIALLLADTTLLPAVAGGESRTARITHYDYTGTVTYSGLWPVAGVTAACSWDLPLWTWVRVGPDWYQCQDRGLLGDGSAGYSWLDLYGVPAESLYGSWAEIEVAAP